jgi:hypothetical protein
LEQGKHFAMYSKPRIQLMEEELIYKHLLWFPNQIHKITNVTSTQKEVGAM